MLDLVFFESTNPLLQLLPRRSVVSERGIRMGAPPCALDYRRGGFGRVLSEKREVERRGKERTVSVSTAGAASDGVGGASDEE